MERAQAIDRRRQAQIENQKASITRLLNASIRDDDTVTPEARYTEEMGILHTATAEAVARSDELEQAAAAVIERAREVAGDAINYDHAARTFADDVLELLSVAVRESKASAG